MIDAPVLLTIRRRFERPPAELLDRLRGLPTSMIVDAQNGRGGLHPGIKPLTPSATILGPAVTARCHPGDNLAAFAALTIAQPGDVLVVAMDGDDGLVATVGDRYAAIARNAGIGGIVVDGFARDLAGIRDTGMPCFCKGITPNTSFSSGPGEVGLRIVVGKVAIEPGDVILGDADGVVVVPRSNLPSVVDALERVKAAEAQMARAIEGGLARFPAIDALLNSSQTRYLD